MRAISLKKLRDTWRREGTVSRTARAMELPRGTVETWLKREGLHTNINPKFRHKNLPDEEIVAALRKHKVITYAANELGMARSSVRWRMKKLGVSL